MEISKEIFCRKQNIIIAVIYRPPGSEMLFNDTFCELLNTFNQEKNIYLLGDYNINLLTPNMRDRVISV